MVRKFSTTYGGKELIVEIGKLAGQANGAIFIRYGETSILVTAVMSDKPKDFNYLPLVVDYEERYYAAGKIKGSRWIKRETRPSEEAILTARMIDRALRPRFDQRIRNEIQIILTVLSFDEKNDPDVPSLIGTSLALVTSDIPFEGPIGAVRIGEVNRKFVLNPSYEEREKSIFDLVVAGTKDKINMIEAKGNIVAEEKILRAIEFAQENIIKIIDFQNEIIQQIRPNKRKLEIFKPNQDIIDGINKFLGNKIEEILYQAKNKSEKRELINSLKESLKIYLKENYYNDPDFNKILSESENILDDQIDLIIHKNILGKELRSDGRKLDQLRPLSIEVGILPRTHGSALFSRGETQALTILTLASPGMEQWIEGMEIETKKHFMHHYNFPPYSTGEVGRIGFPGRREIGHGALVEKSLEPVIPSKEKFPYTIRLVSEILSSNGSTSMASVCASSLAMMDGGVPIKKPVAGISMGLISSPDGKNFKILTDIQGEEDSHGDMDLKIAGTEDGITGIQMDVKIEGVNNQILEKAFQQAKRARLEILEAMKKVISKPRENISLFAPKVYLIKVNPEKIRMIIGPQGKTINEIISETGVQIDIEDNGSVYVTSENEDMAKKALAWIKNLTKEIHQGDIFEGKITRLVDFGAFVEIGPNQEGLIHISEFPQGGKNLNNLKIGDMVQVKVKNIDELGRVNLTMKIK